MRKFVDFDVYDEDDDIQYVGVAEVRVTADRPTELNTCEITLLSIVLHDVVAWLSNGKDRDYGYGLNQHEENGWKDIENGSRLEHLLMHNDKFISEAKQNST